MLHLIHSQCNDCKTHESYRVIDKVISAGNKCEEFKKKNASINQCILGISLKHSHSTVTGFIILHGDDSCMGIHTDKTKSHTHTHLDKLEVTEVHLPPAVLATEEFPQPIVRNVHNGDTNMTNKDQSVNEGLRENKWIK